jgi:hypothetical protein
MTLYLVIQIADTQIQKNTHLLANALKLRNFGFGSTIGFRKERAVVWREADMIR